MGSNYGENEEQDGRGGGGGRKEEGKWGVQLVNGFGQTQGGVFSVFEGADSGHPLETCTDTRIHTPSMKGQLKKRSKVTDKELRT